MPFPGGSSAKFGGRYEDWWTAHSAMRVLAEEAVSIYLEEPGEEGEGYEFALQTEEGLEYHQVKRQRAREGRWDIANLRSAGVIRAIERRLEKPEGKFVFVSTHSAYALEELSQRARSTNSLQTFFDVALRSEKWLGEFNGLKTAWGAERDDEWTWGALRRVYVETISERKLADLVTLQAEGRLAGNPLTTSETFLGVLRDSVNERLTGLSLWRLLESKQVAPNRATSERLAALAVHDANERFKASRSGSRIAGALIGRPETQDLRQAAADQRLALLQGQAGMGKSEVLSELIEGFDAEEIPYLVMRLDRLPATATSAQLGQALGLPASPQVTLASAAAGRDSYLVVDQLDALSTTSGRKPHFLDCVEEMLRQALANRSIHIVLSCRSFDASNDARLRRLFEGNAEPTAVTVGPLLSEQIDRSLTTLGYTPARLSKGLKEFLAVPLHLALFSQLPVRDPAELPRLRNLRDLYDAFWDVKQEEVGDKLQRDPDWASVIDALVDYMSDEQALEAPRVVVDSWRRDVDAMLSSGVLLADRDGLAFIHETFFDYAFARRFTGRRRTLAELLSRDQFLFRRAQVRQILEHMRQGQPQEYMTNLKFLLEQESIRFHLKELVVSWLGTVDDPRQGEWELLETMLDGRSAPLRERAWRGLCSPEWFRFLFEKGKLKHWLNEGGSLEERALAIISAAGKENAEKAAAVLEEHQRDRGVADEKLEATLLRSDLASSRRLFELFLTEVSRDPELSRRDFWYLAHDLPEKRPEWACELLGLYLAKRLERGELIVKEEGLLGGTHLAPRGLHLREYVQGAASGAPLAYVEHVWPIVQKIIEATATSSEAEELQPDAIWRYRHLGESAEDLENDLLVGTETALSALGADHPKTFLELVEDLKDCVLESVVYFLYQGFSANPALADAALNYLVSDQRRLRVGYGNGYNCWGTRRMLEKVASHASSEAMTSFEPVLLTYYTSWERSAASRRHGYSPFGFEQFVLLGAIPADKQTMAMRKRHAELRRKFRADDADPPERIRGGAVTSPIPESNARKMSNANWLRAMEVYFSNDHANRKDWLKGGAHQLSQVLENLTKEDPGRFARLALEMPDSLHVYYFDAILRGVGESEVPVSLETAEQLIARCHRLPNRPCGQWIGYPLHQFSDLSMSDEAVQTLSWYATCGAGPSEEGTEGRSEEQLEQEQLLMRGLNSVRGAATREIARLIYNNPSNISAFAPALRHLVGDPSAAIRAVAAEVVLWLLRHDTAIALEHFLELTNHPDDALLATQPVRRFLIHRGSDDFEALAPLIGRMIDSEIAVVRSEGAAQVTLAGLHTQAAQQMADDCLSGSSELRLGAARVYAGHLEAARYQGRCEDVLGRLLDDSDEEVRKTAAESVQALRNADLEAFRGLIESFLASRALEAHGEMLLFAVEDAASAPVDLSLNICQRMLDSLEAPADIGRRDARIAHEISEVLLRAYVAASDDGTKNEVLDVIERGLMLDAYGLQQVLIEHDRE